MLTGKQKSYLRGLANTRNALFQVGKDGLSYNLYKTIEDSLEAHELVKVSVLKTCTEDFKELAFDLAMNTHSEVVQTIGRTVVLYRKSKEQKIQLP
ncbi:ribosome assembly RNA-binding protein YhbY [Anaerorhabdus furcosa]|uniref:RNA-binding protein n=1 Tax=Anaerorhabdus furcosa TaxID=118967 RepID=A0A1T4NKD3_9FIRM|nr:ribosome assembly RNA-binding protein YhbY [Anaerorhabdus furcosa]SJZ79218.1 RNA-binding protein [Anaerorhabdus furcosa]